MKNSELLARISLAVFIVIFLIALAYIGGVAFPIFMVILYITICIVNAISYYVDRNCEYVPAKRNNWNILFLIGNLTDKLPQLIKNKKNGNK